MRQYHVLLRCLLDDGVRKDDRTGTLAMGAPPIRSDLNEGSALAFALVGRREEAQAQFWRCE